MSISPSTAYQPFDDPAYLYIPQRILYPFDISFDQSALADFPAAGTIAELLTASITVGLPALGTGQTLTADTVITLAAARIPTSERRSAAAQRLLPEPRRPAVHHIAAIRRPDLGRQSAVYVPDRACPTMLDTAAAYDYIQQVITHFNNTYQDPGGVDPFDLNNPQAAGSRRRVRRRLHRDSGDP